MEVQEGIVMSNAVMSGLLKAGWTVEQIMALALAMKRSGIDPYAKSYAHGMDRAFEEYGEEGVKLQVSYMLLNLKQWKGQEARDCKLVLRGLD